MSDALEKYQDKTPEQVRERPWTAPRVDIYENDDEVLLLADVPGVHRDNLKIHLDNEQLTLSARLEETQGGEALRREYHAVDFWRSFVVPAGIDGRRIAADLRNGVLSLHLPKSEGLKPRQIQVKAAS
ncbi:MAG: Hsp20/alpha crystallin family protein [Deltaproteobacteria bacterium]|nr:Hsp20/alpha crystallin family protein [Deltaproteobacteria bacterium]